MTPYGMTQYAARTVLAVPRFPMSSANRKLPGWMLQAALTLCAPVATAQDECGTIIDAGSVPLYEFLEQTGAYKLPAALPKYKLQVPIAVHVVRQSDGTGGLTVAEADQRVDDCSNFFAPIGIHFHRGSLDYIDNDDFYFNIDTMAEIDQLRQINVVVNSVNVYFTPNLAYEGGGLNGISSFSADAVQGIAMRNGAPVSSFPHEMGHYFDLFHTHETAFGLECPDGSNCATAGDKLCDTPADPGLDGAGMMGAECTYTGTGTRCGDPFAPDTTNLMSYAVPRECRDHFSPQQETKALATLINIRSNLIGAPGLNVTWVDFGYGGTELGTYAQPFNDLANAVSAVLPGGRVVIKPGATSATATIAKPLTLDTFRGTARIGG